MLVRDVAVGAAAEKEVEADALAPTAVAAVKVGYLGEEWLDTALLHYCVRHSRSTSGPALQCITRRFDLSMLSQREHVRIVVFIELRTTSVGTGGSDETVGTI